MGGYVARDIAPARKDGEDQDTSCSSCRRSLGDTIGEDAGDRGGAAGDAQPFVDVFQYRLSRADAEDVGQSVWLCLVGQLDKVRDPAALPGWLATTTRRECWRVLRAARRPHTPACGLDAENLPAEQDEDAEQELLEAERHAALREALARLPLDDQRLIVLLIADPPPPYAEISVRLGIPVGNIGPSRGRCLAKIRRYPTIAALINSEEDQQPTANHQRLENARPPSTTIISTPS